MDNTTNKNILELDETLANGDLTPATNTDENVSDTPPIEFIDLSEEELEDQMIAVDDYNAIYRRSLAIREIFPSLNDTLKWNGKWLLKTNCLPHIVEVKRISEVELYTDEKIDYDNWNSALNLALSKIEAMHVMLNTLSENIRKNRTPRRRPNCSPEKGGSGYYVCTRCHMRIPFSLVNGMFIERECHPKRIHRFRPYVKDGYVGDITEPSEVSSL